MAVWGKSLLSTHMLVGLNNSNVEKCVSCVCGLCESLVFGAHNIRKGKLRLNTTHTS